MRATRSCAACTPTRSGPSTLRSLRRRTAEARDRKLAPWPSGCGCSRASAKLGGVLWRCAVKRYIRKRAPARTQQRLAAVACALQRWGLHAVWAQD